MNRQQKLILAALFKQYNFVPHPTKRKFHILIAPTGEVLKPKIKTASLDSTISKGYVIKDKKFNLTAIGFMVAGSMIKNIKKGQ